MHLHHHIRHGLAALCIGLLVGITCWHYHQAFERKAGDIYIPLCAARELLKNGEPYTCPFITGKMDASYPLTTALIAMPFTPLPDELAAGIIIGIASTLLAYGLLRTGETWRLLVFASFPLWQGVQAGNLVILLLALYYLPGLSWLWVAKPHTGLPIAIARRSRRMAAISASIVAISLIVRPVWPWEWLGQIGVYTGRPLILAYPFVLALLLCWRDPRAQYVLSCAVVPLRGFYDYVLFFVVPNTWQSMAVMVGLSWVLYGLYYFSLPAPNLILIGAFGMVAWPHVSKVLKLRISATNALHDG